ncbi:MAG: hypothetical protein ACI87W_000625 [Halieaceae bacterium]|jgi:hypothetical protein
MNATSMKFEDNTFDVVFSSMFLHELPLKDIRAFFAEEAFAADLDAPAKFDSLTGRMDPRGTRWYGFGGWKKPAAGAEA